MLQNAIGWFLYGHEVTLPLTGDIIYCWCTEAAISPTWSRLQSGISMVEQCICHQSRWIYNYDSVTTAIGADNSSDQCYSGCMRQTLITTEDVTLTIEYRSEANPIFTHCNYCLLCSEHVCYYCTARRSGMARTAQQVPCMQDSQ